MFKRALQVKMVKDEKKTAHEPDPIDVIETKAAIIAVYAKETVVTVGKVIAAYIAVDTVRQIALTKFNK